uniref:Uncharacterized protein n=1 Tax=Acrobeloides nanus TaxID=290746 RepID=A0A914DF92_9BILA
MGFSYGVIAGSRIIQILESAFDPNKDSEPHNEIIRGAALDSYVVIIASIVIERSMASIWLKSYETTKTWTFVAVAIPFSWVVGGIIQSMVIFSILSPITWGCVALSVIFISMNHCLIPFCLVPSHQYNPVIIGLVYSK